MNKKSLFLYGCMAILIIGVWFAYQKITDDTYEGMSIIPKHHKDIPLYEGLKPTDSVYVIEGNKWSDVYSFYIHELPRLGWKVEYEDSALNDNKSDSDWAGFNSRWIKEGFEGELWISAHFNKYEEKTEVIFDKTP